MEQYTYIGIEVLVLTRDFQEVPPLVERRMTPLLGFDKPTATTFVGFDQAAAR